MGSRMNEESSEHACHEESTHFYGISGRNCDSPCILELFEYHEHTFLTIFQKFNNWSPMCPTGRPIYIFLQIQGWIMTLHAFWSNLSTMNTHFEQNF